MVNHIPAGDGKIADLFYSAQTDPNYISIDKVHIEENTGPHTGLYICSSDTPFLPVLENPGPQCCIFVHQLLCFLSVKIQGPRPLHICQSAVCIGKSMARPIHICPIGPLFSVCIGKFRVRPLHICPSGPLFSVCIGKSRARPLHICPSGPLFSACIRKSRA